MAKMDIMGLADPQDALMMRAVPGIMDAIAMFDNRFEALRMLLVLIARKCNVTNSYAFLSSPGVADDDDLVINKIGACLQAGCTDYADAETVFNESLTEVNSVVKENGSPIPAATPSPVPHHPYSSLDPNGGRWTRWSRRPWPGSPLQLSPPTQHQLHEYHPSLLQPLGATPPSPERLPFLASSPPTARTMTRSSLSVPSPSSKRRTSYFTGGAH
jgi:hypothetical protein